MAGGSGGPGGPGSGGARGRSPGGGVESRVRYSRNYQPPRRRRTGQEQAEKEGEQYEADFESEEEYLEQLGHKEEEEEEEDEHLDVEDDREAWLREQAERGKARQRALVSRLGGGEPEEEGSRPRRKEVRGSLVTEMRRRTVEKESSRDSAYGFSADSRVPTREPTPEHRVTATRGQEIKGARRVLAERPRRPGTGGRRQEVAGIKQRKTVQIEGCVPAQAEEAGPALEFLQEVTSDLLARGLYTERGLRSALDSVVRGRATKVRSRRSASAWCFPGDQAGAGGAAGPATPGAWAGGASGESEEQENAGPDGGFRRRRPGQGAAGAVREASQTTSCTSSPEPGGDQGGEGEQGGGGGGDQGQEREQGGRSGGDD